MRRRRSEFLAFVRPREPSGRAGANPRGGSDGTMAGKAEHTSFAVPTVSLHVHERIDLTRRAVQDRFQ